MSSAPWPSVNAALNATSAALLLAGFWCIRTHRVAAHRACMVSACATSSAFFVSYVLYHARVGSVRFEGTGWGRGAYLGILATHTVLAVVIVPLVIRTVWFAARGAFPRHRALARWTLPLWLYVSVTGVVVYWMLYH